MLLPDPAEFYRHIQIDPETGCHIWLGGVDKHGYGRVKLRPWEGGQKTWYSAHVVGWKLRFGAVPPETPCLDHLCRNRRCVFGEPGTFTVYHYETDEWKEITSECHLQPVTSRENTLRGMGPTAINFRKDTCNLGHKLEGRRKVYGNRTNEEGRYCLVCHRARMRAIRASRSSLPEAA